MDIRDLFRAQGKHLFWARLNDDRIDPSAPGVTLQPHDAYYVIRLKEMYLARTRTLWRKSYPVLYGVFNHAADTEYGVAGPGQLKDLGDVNLENVLTVDYRLAGPTVYTGEEFTLLVGLYSVPGQDAAKALISTVSAVAAIGGIALAQAASIANVVKQGVESLLNLDTTGLVLGIQKGFAQGRLETGTYVGIGAPEASIPVSRLWLSGGRLKQGLDPIASTAYEDSDYMVLDIETLDRREDWPRLPGVAEFQQKFGAVMRDGATSVSEKRERLALLWPQFEQVIAESSLLTRPDRERIKGNVSADLAGRLDAMATKNPFETRAWGSKTTERQAPEEFDLAEVGDYPAQAKVPAFR
jgi:hypothetical protein